MKELNDRQQRWYEMGTKAAAEYSDEETAMQHMSMNDLSDMVTGRWSNEIWYHAGFIGRKPEYVQAVRFGKIPADGRSVNHADGTAENGVSCVKIIRSASDAESKSIYDVTLGYQGIEKIVISGWYLGGSGADGEPLLVDAEQ